VGELNFNNKQCIRALLRIGFYLNNKRHGQHDKYFPPKAVADNIAVGRARFIMIPRHKDLHCQREILSELRMMGGDDLIDLFKKNL
jgi:predicted RNA binding protein YcfA (HicA-like mRNA interferase family)